MKRFFLLGVSGVFCGGIALGLFLNGDEARVVTLVGVALVIAFTIVFQKSYIGLTFCLGTFAGAGMLLSSLTMEHYQTLLVPNNIQGLGVVRGEMQKGTFDARVVLALYDCDGHICPKERILVQTSRYETFTDGMRVRLSPCDLERPEQFDPHFDYPMYLAKEGIGFVATDCPLERVGTRGDWLRQWLHDTRIFIASMLGQRIPEPEGGLARGLILGGSDELPETLERDFRTVGLSHIVAVSGYNISVLAGGFFLLGIGLGWYRKRAVWIALLGTVLFVLLVGAPASAVRAALIAIAGFGALLVSRPTSMGSLLCLAGAIMLLGNPLLLRYDIGFQLSFLATFAILFSAPWRSRFESTGWLWGSVREAFLITFSVLLFVTPLTLLYFGTLSPYALLANTLVLPLVPVAFLLSLAVVLFGWIPGFGALFGWVAYGALHMLVGIAEVLARFPGANASYTGVNGWMVVGWYGLCSLFFWWQKRLLEKSRAKVLS